MNRVVPKISVVLLVLGSLGIGGICAAGAHCPGDPAVAETPSGCHESSPEVVSQECCCPSQATVDQAALERAKTTNIVPATLPVDGVPVVASAVQAAGLDHPTPPPRVGRHALLCVYLN